VKILTIREIAKKMGLATGNLSKIQLVRTIQEAEGNSPCFATQAVRECNQINCLWREDCSIAYFKGCSLQTPS